MLTRKIWLIWILGILPTKLCIKNHLIHLINLQLNNWHISVQKVIYNERSPQKDYRAQWQPRTLYAISTKITVWKIRTTLAQSLGIVKSSPTCTCPIQKIFIKDPARPNRASCNVCSKHSLTTIFNLKSSKRFRFKILNQYSHQRRRFQPGHSKNDAFPPMIIMKKIQHQFQLTCPLTRTFQLWNHFNTTPIYSNIRMKIRTLSIIGLTIHRTTIKFLPSTLLKRKNSINY